MDEDIAAKIERLEELTDDLCHEERFRRLTAYVIVKTLVSELDEAAKEGDYPSNNIRSILVSAEANAAALTGANKDSRSESDLRSFYYEDIYKLDMPTCFGKR